MAETKLHLGCGTVYLKGWVNIDISNKLASDYPELVEHNATTLDKYYKYPYGDAYNDIGNRPSGNDIIVDESFDLLHMPYPYCSNEVDEILAVSVLEHFSRHEAPKLLREWYRILKVGGILSIYVPDLIDSVELLMSTGEKVTMAMQEYAISLIYGSQKNVYSFHKWGYTPIMLMHQCKEIGFIKVEVPIEKPIKHKYPMFMVRAVK